MKTLSGIARGAASNLVERSADVTLKERRPLVLVPRETPLNLVHIENMRAATLAGAILVPAMPAFYTRPRTIEDLADFVVGRVFSLLGIDHRLFPAWEG
jgi:4-hydroxy-3-polyprenylbenzoate decarboxylase